MLLPCGRWNSHYYNIFALLLYQRGLTESFRKVCSNHGVQVYFKGGTTIRNLLMAPMDQDPMRKRSGVIYRYKCDRVECDEEYIGESLRTFGERFKEHLKAPSPIFDHYNTTGHKVSLDNFSIMGREEQNLMRTIKEALYIRVNNPSLNRNIGKNTICLTYGMRFCLTTPELKINRPCGHSICHMAITSASTPTLQWLFHLPHGNNICHIIY